MYFIKIIFVSKAVGEKFNPITILTLLKFKATIMQQILIIILVVIFGLYILLILYYWKSWLSISDFNLGDYQNGMIDNNPKTKITVIIPARNEEAFIADCLNAICNQSYPKHLVQVLVVNDHSTDNTAAIVKLYESKNITLISLKDFINGKINSYKKKAIEIAIEQSTGQLIVTTDADSIVKENWLQTISAFYEQYQPVAIVMPVKINLAKNSIVRILNSPLVIFLHIFQSLDFTTLQGITGAGVHKKIHSMCNGANLAYSKNVFEEVGGFAGIDTIASGDDMLLIHKMFTRYPDKVMFLKSKKVIVQTAAVNSIKEFFNQRIRWASKADKYNDKRIFAVLLLVYFINVIILLLPLLIIFYTHKLSIINLWLMLLFIKTAIELIFLYPVAKFFNTLSLLWLFPLMQPFHIIYTVVAGWLGKFGNYSWKERKVK